MTDPTEVGEMGESFVSAEAARRLSCDAGVVEVVEDEHGTPLSVGRKRRTIAGRSNARCSSVIGCAPTPDVPTGSSWKVIISSTGPTEGRPVYRIQHCCEVCIIAMSTSTDIRSISGKISGPSFAILTVGR